jgi:hypothetical protein
MSQIAGGRSVGRRENLGLHQLHGGAAALDLALPGLDAEHFRPTRFALKSLSKLVGHERYLLSSGGPPLRPQLLSCMGWPQQASSPLPPFVTIISVPHLVQKYRFPTWLAKAPPPPRVSEDTLPSGLGSRSQSSQWVRGSQGCVLQRVRRLGRVGPVGRMKTMGQGVVWVTARRRPARAKATACASREPESLTSWAPHQLTIAGGGATF